MTTTIILPLLALSFCGLIFYGLVAWLVWKTFGILSRIFPRIFPIKFRGLISTILFVIIFVISFITISGYLLRNMRAPLRAVPCEAGCPNEERPLSSEAFAKTITHDDLQEIFQVMFETNSAWYMEGISHGPPPNHIIENEFLDKSFKLYRKDGSPIVIVSQTEFNNLHIVPYAKITKIEYGISEGVVKKNTVIVSWFEEWDSDGQPGYNGQRGNNSFIKLDKKWKNLQGSSERNWAQ